MNNFKLASYISDPLLLWNRSAKNSGKILKIRLFSPLLVFCGGGLAWKSSHTFFWLQVDGKEKGNAKAIIKIVEEWPTYFSVSRSATSTVFFIDLYGTFPASSGFLTLKYLIQV